LSEFTLDEISRLLDRKYRRGEAMFRGGDMRGAVHDLYTDDAYYLTPQLRVLQGREAILAFFEAIKSEIGEVRVSPVCLWGDPGGTVYQFCNTVRRAPGNGAVTHAHYIAAFRQVGEDWLCEMEVVAAGHIDATTATHYLRSRDGYR
jgi:ketosteroid isomerase-like protein